MRLRKVKGAAETIAAHPQIVIPNGEELKGNWQSVFEKNQPLYIEVGMGKGQFVIGMAQKNPHLNFIGIEKFDSVMVRALEKVIEAGELPNLKLLKIDAEDLTIGDLVLLESGDKISADMKKIAEHIETVNNIQANIDSVDLELRPLVNNRDNLKHKLQMLKEYDEELIEYKGKYDKIEVIKFYSSPTTGIQTLFMELYMNKIISLANQLLAMLFEGQYKLEPFIINETEFRIPCSGGLLLHDDISSMSSSQVACISMILSFALLFQSSSKLNILKLDEIDGALDSTNRRNFIVMLDQMLNVLQCQQCIIISHNDELNLDNCDVIVLKHSNIEPISGNVIWSY